MSESEARLAVVASLRTVQVRRKNIVRKREVLHPLRRLVIEQQSNDVGAGVMPRRVSRVLRYADRGEIDGGIDNPFAGFRQLLRERTAVRPVDYGMSAALMDQVALVLRVAHLLDHLPGDNGARRQDETGSFDRIDLADGIVGFPAKRVRKGLVHGEARPRSHMYLLVLGIHGVFGQRLKVLPATQRA